jgi:hypothetical protein
MVTDTQDQILGYIRTNKQVRPHDLVRKFNISQVAVHKQLNNLLKKGLIKKVGRAPLVFYIPAEVKKLIVADIPEDSKKVIDQNYLYISPMGELLYGFEGFTSWVNHIKESSHLPKLASEYVQSIKQQKKYRSENGWLEATGKLKDTFPIVYPDKMFYGDFYSLPKFGKTKLGQLVLYAKQSQNRQLIQEISQQIKPHIEQIIKEYKIKAVGFIPPTIPRNLQFINELAENLALRLPYLPLVKVAPGEVIIAQKTLSRLEERITNAQTSIFLQNTHSFSPKNYSQYHSVLLIDDAAGSGASFNETAKKLKEIGIGQNKIVAYAIVGSYKGFEVIREV